MRKIVAVSAGVASWLACSGVGSEPVPEVAPEPEAPEVPEPAPPAPTIGSVPLPRAVQVLQPVAEGGRCRVTTPGGQPLADVPGACPVSWGVAISPTNPADVVVLLGDQPPQRGGAPLPPFPEGGPKQVDQAGFGDDGALMVARYDFVDGDPEAMLSSVRCSWWRHDGQAWEKVRDDEPYELGEGSSPPWCSGTELRFRPALGDKLAEESWKVPDAFEHTLPDGAEQWTIFADTPFVVAGTWFEGMRPSTPMFIERDRTWAAVSELGPSGQPIHLGQQEGLWVACAQQRAVIIDPAQDHRVVWSGEGACPIIWTQPG